MKTGELFIKEGLIRPDDVDRVLLMQKKRRDSLSLEKSRLFGMILCDLNLVTPMDNYYVLHKYNKLMSIQSVLVSKQILPQETVLGIENESQKQDIPFISRVLDTGLVSTRRMQSLLFGLFHIPFRSIHDFVFNKKDGKELVRVLDEHQSQKNRIIPLVLKGNIILFGVTDPENIIFLRQLNDQYPQYRFKTLFITVSDFSRYYGRIYAAGRGCAPVEDPPPDLSLLLRFKVSINNPEQEKASIRSLYHRYERLRNLIGNPKRDNRQDEFDEFIVQTHKKISREYQSRCIEFSLKKQDRDVRIIAFPRT